MLGKTEILYCTKSFFITSFIYLCICLIVILIILNWFYLLQLNLLIRKCVNLTDNGIEALFKETSLKSLDVHKCPNITQMGRKIASDNLCEIVYH